MSGEYLNKCDSFIGRVTVIEPPASTNTAEEESSPSCEKPRLNQDKKGNLARLLTDFFDVKLARSRQHIVISPMYDHPGHKEISTKEKSCQLLKVDEKQNFLNDVDEKQNLLNDFQVKSITPQECFIQLPGSTSQHTVNANIRTSKWKPSKSLHEKPGPEDPVVCETQPPSTQESAIQLTLGTLNDNERDDVIKNAKTPKDIYGKKPGGTNCRNSSTKCKPKESMESSYENTILPTVLQSKIRFFLKSPQEPSATLSTTGDETVKDVKSNISHFPQIHKQEENISLRSSTPTNTKENHCELSSCCLKRVRGKVSTGTVTLWPKDIYGCRTVQRKVAQTHTTKVAWDDVANLLTNEDDFVEDLTPNTHLDDDTIEIDQFFASISK